MSCTVLAIPYALAWLIGTAVNLAMKDNDIQIEDFDTTDLNINNTDNIIEKYGRYNNTCNDINIIDAKHFIEKSFETPFMDKNILMKTLEEHGVKNIQESAFGNISGVVDSYSLNFEKTETDKPYYVRISCLESDNAEEKIGDLSSEYALNVQEEAYLNIVDKLKANNMEIEDEEVMDDNTIVLTINLE